MFSTSSRYMLSNILVNTDEEVFTSARDKLRLSDGVTSIIQHVVIEGDTFHSLAQRFYGNAGFGADLWWAIADFQDDPTHDPTVTLEPGSVVYIPPLQYIQEELLGTGSGISETL